MKKLIAFVLLFALSSLASALTLTAKAYPSTVVQPTSITLTVNGAAGPACTLVTSAAGLVPTCDLSSLPNSGTFSIVMTAVSTASGCTPTATGATCTVPGGSASSAPFNLVLSGSVSSPAALQVNAP